MGLDGWSPTNGARGRNRTRDIFITSEVLYQLSYSGGLPILGSWARHLRKGTSFHDGRRPSACRMTARTETAIALPTSATNTSMASRAGV